MGNLLDDLTGGMYSASRKPQENATGKTYSIYIQFDGDEPALMYDKIDPEKIFRLSLSAPKPGPPSEIIFTDTTTGKTFKIFAK